MRCSSDLRQRVGEFVRGGGSKAKAARRFQGGEASVYRWLKPGGVLYKRPGLQRPYKLDWDAWRRHGEDTLIGRKQNGLGISRFPAIASGTHCENWRGPINKRLGYHERDPLQRKRFLPLRERFWRRGKQPESRQGNMR